MKRPTWRAKIAVQFLQVPLYIISAVIIGLAIAFGRYAGG
jgi:hypothetical protein